MGPQLVAPHRKYKVSVWCLLQFGVALIYTAEQSLWLGCSSPLRSLLTPLALALRVDLPGVLLGQKSLSQSVLHGLHRHELSRVVQVGLGLFG